MQVKICGCRTLEDARAAVLAGADMLGFNFYPKSPRYLSPEACRAIAVALREQKSAATLVGVFVNAPAEQISETLEYCGLDLAQLHGDEPPETLQQVGERAFKALRPFGASALETALSLYPARAAAPAWLVDAYHTGIYGGSGQTGDWSLAAGLAKTAPILLAGGLTPQNVAQAISQVHPWGVDVASGVESTPGVKDYERIHSFVMRAKKV